MAQQDTNTRALKGLVIAMGVLIVVGLTVVVVTIAMRLTGPEGADGQTAPNAQAGPTAQTAPTARAGGGDRTPAAGAPGARPFGELQLGMADSCRIVEATASGGTLVVRLDGPAQDGCGQLVVVDPAQGRVLGRIRPGKAPGSRPDGGEAAR